MSEKGNAYIDDLSYRSDAPDLDNEKSEIAKFFIHTNVFVTGGTGFLGKLIIEKLLRSCPGIQKVYMVVRPKKGKTAQERFKEQFEDVVYEKLKREKPNFLNKVIMIEGDATQDDFGLSLESKKLLMDTNIIIHAAATVRFDEKLRLALNINVKNTKYLIQFAKQLPNLKAFVHVSTAFSNCIHKNIDEVHYKMSIDDDKLLAVLDILDDEKIEKITPVLLDKWPNAYVFTKAIGENIVLRYSNDIPICIVRPSIVTSTFRDPIAGWINNYYGATGVAMGSAAGLLRTLYCIPENVAEIIPADFVVSNIIATAWDIDQRRRSAKLAGDSNISDDERIPIYNCVSSCQNPLPWKLFMNKIETYGLEIPPLKIVWYYMLILNRYLFVHNLCVFFFHLVPAAIVDTLAYLTGRKPILLDAYRKISKFSHVLKYFSTQEWNFCNENVLKLWQKLNPYDQKVFNFDIKSLNWDDYFYTHIRGLRLYLFKDSFDNLEQALIRYNKLRIAHYTLVTLTSLLVLWMAVSLLSFLWSLCPLSH